MSILDDEVLVPHYALVLAVKYICESHPFAPVKVQKPDYWISAAKGEIDPSDVFAPWNFPNDWPKRPLLEKALELACKAIDARRECDEDGHLIGDPLDSQYFIDEAKIISLQQEQQEQRQQTSS